MMEDVRWDAITSLVSAGLCAGCAYVLYQRSRHLSAVSSAPSFPTVSRLLEYMAEHELTEIDLVSVTGKVSPLSEAIPSKYLDNVMGVLAENKTIEHKKEWSAALQRWMDDEHIISVVRKEVSFTLEDGVAHLRVLGAALSQKIPLQVVYDRFEPVEERSPVQHLFSFMVGSQLKGHQYVERMLPVNTILTAVGSVKLTSPTASSDSCSPFIEPPATGLPLLLSRKSLNEILQELKDATFVPRVSMVMFGAVSLGALSYMGWRRYKRWREKRRRERLMEEMERMRENGGSQSESCVVCMDNPRGVVLIPCGHVCVCLLCGEGMTFCPVCRGDIEQVVRTFNA